MILRRAVRYSKQIHRFNCRLYHPGFSRPNMKIALPFPPKDVECKYEIPVIGNAVQKLQLEKNIGYSTNDIISKMRLQEEFYEGNHVQFVPTSHGTPVSIALNSCRNLRTETIELALSNLHQRSILDSDGALKRDRFESEYVLETVAGVAGVTGAAAAWSSSASVLKELDEEHVLKNAMNGVLSDYADSIYIANDYLLVGDGDNHYLFVANYPFGAEMRDTERVRVAATGMLKGQIPIILDAAIDFEGEANVKFLPLQIMAQNKQFQAALTYDSSRSDSRSVNAINDHLERLGLPLIFEIKLSPRKGLEEMLYHQDCLLNFHVDHDDVQCLDFGDRPIHDISPFDVLERYSRNGTVAMVRDGVDALNMAIIQGLFENVIEINHEDDVLGANIIMSRSGCVGSSSLSQSVKDQLMRNNKFLGYAHPSVGGGGAHKCCSNITTANGSGEVSIGEWLQFAEAHGMEIPGNFLRAVALEKERLSGQMDKIS